MKLRRQAHGICRDGLLEATILEAYGGLGPHYISCGKLVREIERIDSGYRSLMSAQPILEIHPIYAYDTKEQRKKCLPGLTAVRSIGSWDPTEPDADAGLGGMQTLVQ